MESIIYITITAGMTQLLDPLFPPLLQVFLYLPPCKEKRTSAPSPHPGCCPVHQQGGPFETSRISLSRRALAVGRRLSCQAMFLPAPYRCCHLCGALFRQVTQPFIIFSLRDWCCLLRLSLAVISESGQLLCCNSEARVWDSVSIGTTAGGKTWEHISALHSLEQKPL